MTDAANGESGGGSDPRGLNGSAPVGLLRGVMQQMPAGVLIAEAPSGRVVLGNAEVAAILRRPFVAASSVEEYHPWRGFHPDGRPYAPREWPLARALLEGETVEGEEIEVERGDGTRGVLRVSASPVRNAEGRIEAAVATLYDVTEQRRAEAGRRFLAEAGQVLASSLDFDATLRNLTRLAVPRLADWCAVDVLEGGRIERLAVEHGDSEKAMLADALFRRFPPDPDAPAGVARVLRTGRAELIPAVDAALLGGLASDEEHRRALLALGPRSAILVPLVARGRVMGAVTLLTAESGRRYDAEDLALAEELALRAALAIDNARLYHDSEAASRAKSDFLAVVSHELRTPLTAVIGYTELLQLGIPEPLTERQSEQVERVEISARHLLQLIEEILSVVSLETGTLTLRREPVPLSELLRRAEAIVRPTVLDPDLTLEILPPEEDVRLESDPDKILQVLLNVLTNAVKFTERGSVRVTSGRAGDRVRIEVSDTGVGLSPEDQERIFEPFWQVERPITRRAGGTGLGLTITRRLLELLGGEIHLESTPGEGSRFTVEIPIG